MIRKKRQIWWCPWQERDVRGRGGRGSIVNVEALLAICTDSTINNYPAFFRFPIESSTEQDILNFFCFLKLISK